MQASFASFGFGLGMAVVLLYLVMVAQFRSFLDPFIIMFAVPMGMIGVVAVLLATGTTLNIESFMGIIVDGRHRRVELDPARRLRQPAAPRGRRLRRAVVEASRIRMRPILMTALATVVGLLPIALKLGAGSEASAPLARAAVGGLTVSTVLTLVLVPAVYELFYARREVAVVRRRCRRRALLAARARADARVRRAQRGAGDRAASAAVGRPSVRPQRGDVVRAITLPGDLVGFYEADALRQGQRLPEEHRRRQGRLGEAGQVLAEIEVPELQQKLKRARANLEVRRLTYERLQQRLEHRQAAGGARGRRHRARASSSRRRPKSRSSRRWSATRRSSRRSTAWSPRATSIPAR